MLPIFTILSLTGHTIMTVCLYLCLCLILDEWTNLVETFYSEHQHLYGVYRYFIKNTTVPCICTFDSSIEHLYLVI